MKKMVKIESSSFAALVRSYKTIFVYIINKKLLLF